MRLPERIVLLLVVLLLFAGFFFQGFGRVDGARTAAFLICALTGIWGMWEIALLSTAEKVALTPYFRLLAFLLLFVVLHLVFLIPLPIGLVRTLSPTWERVATSADASNVVLPHFLPLATAPAQARLSLNQAIAAACLFLAAGMLCRKPRNAKVLLIAVALFSVFEGWAGVVTSLLLGADRARGGLYNPDHHAAAVMIGLPVALAFALGSKVSRSSHEERASRDLRLLLLTLLAVAALGWLFSHSRGALISGIGAGIAWVIWEVRLAPGQDRRMKRIETGAAIAVAAAVPLALTGSSLIESYSSRFNQLGEGLIGRIAMWKAALRGLAESRFLGMGPGGTEYAINRFLENVAARKNPIWAHNDYVQFVCDFGVPASIIAGVLLVLAVRSIVRPILRRSRSNPSRVSMERAALIGVAAVLAHSVLDFPLRIPVMSFLLLVLCAYLATMEARRARRRTGKGHEHDVHHENRASAAVGR